MKMEDMIQAMACNGIVLQIGDAAVEAGVGATRFGGRPDVPADFVWPVFRTATYEDDEEKDRPLTFLAQFQCAELAAWDVAGLLPKTGLLSFFYEMDSERWGYDPQDEGCARVYWFADSTLAPREFPEDLTAQNRLPARHITLQSQTCLPDWADFVLGREDMLADCYDEFYEERAMLEGDRLECSSKLLGWPDIIQNNMTRECELVRRGYYLGGLWEDIPVQVYDEATQHSLAQWQLLFQLDTAEQGAFTLLFGDSGRLYFYIRKEDLAQQNFDKVWTILQCY